MLQLPAYNNICSIPSDPKKTKHEVLQQKWNHLENFESLKKDVFALLLKFCVCANVIVGFQDVLLAR